MGIAMATRRGKKGGRLMVVGATREGNNRNEEWAVVYLLYLWATICFNVT
jgi:hypothetical protein